MATRKKPSGGASMAATGKRCMQLWWMVDDLAIIARAAAMEGRPWTQFVQHAALTAAKKNLEKSSKSA